MNLLTIFLYLGPETILPIGSVIAALVGFLLVGWRWILVIVRRLLGKTPAEAPAETFDFVEDEEIEA